MAACQNIPITPCSRKLASAKKVLRALWSSMAKEGSLLSGGNEMRRTDIWWPDVLKDWSDYDLNSLEQFIHEERTRRRTVPKRIVYGRPSR